MTTRFFIIGLGLLLLVCGVLIPSISAQSISISQPELIYRASPTTHKKKFYACDAVSATLRKNSENMYIFRSTCDATFRFCGPLSNAEQNPMFKFNTDMFAIPSGMDITTKGIAGAKNYANIYLKNVFDLGGGELLGFLHLEYLKGTQGNLNPACAACPFYPAIYRISLCHSENSGESWTFCGDIIGASDNKPGQCNIGGAAYVVAGDYFYVYFNEKSPTSAIFPSVARALKKEVIDSVRKLSPRTAVWHKYNGNTGKWDQDGLSGLGTRILSGDNLDLHADAAYCAACKRYLLIVRDNGKSGLYLYQSTNGLEWKNPQFLAADYTENGILHQSVYPYFASLSGDANTDCSVVGKEFFIYYIAQHFPERDNPPRFFIATDQPVFRVKVQVKAGD
jgi:hypothetical protein